MSDPSFLSWWFDQHYILSTIFTPFFTLLWSIYNGLTVRALAAASLFAFLWFARFFTALRKDGL